MNNSTNKTITLQSGFLESRMQLFITILLGILLIAVASYFLANKLMPVASNSSIHNIIYSDEYELTLSFDEKEWIDKNPIVRLGIDRAFPPFGSISEDNKYIGFSADYMRLIEHRTGLKFDIEKDATWSETMEMAILGRLDMIAAVVKTEQRQQYVDFTQPYIKKHTVIVNVGKKHGYIGSIKYLKGKKVAIEKGSYSAAEISQKYPKILFVKVDNTKAALKLVSQGDADAYVGNAETARKVIQENGFYNLSFSGETEFSSSHSIGVVKPNKILLSVLNKTLTSVSPANKSSLANYWFGLNSQSFIPQRAALLIGSALMAILTLLLIWAYSLRKTKNKLKESQQKLKLQSEIDELTGLGNRRSFYKRLNKVIGHADENSQSFVLFFLDLGMFKEVNDSFGHEVGDLLLIEVAKRLRTCVTRIGSVSRIGGDEFVIIVPRISGKIEIREVAEKLLNRLSYPFIINRNEVNITTSIGITRYPDDTRESKELVMNGDQAMYYSKRNGRDCFSYFNKAIQQEALEKTNLTKDLRVAIYERQFTLHFQPIIDLSNNKITKAEALIRWQHPRRGLIAPAEFIPLAEEAGLINAIGEWAFKEAMDQTAIIQKKYDKDFQMTVNTSPLQYQKNAMNVLAWSQYLNTCGLTGKNVVLEITEGLLMEMSESVINNLFHLRDLSISVAIDDFGTGYSTLAYLKKYDIDYLKIDQSFVSNLTLDSDDFVLVKAIVDMAKTLKIKVIAEGVEGEEQKDILSKAACDYAQGYYFSKPLCSTDFMSFLANWDKEAQHAPSKLTY